MKIDIIISNLNCTVGYISLISWLDNHSQACNCAHRREKRLRRVREQLHLIGFHCEGKFRLGEAPTAVPLLRRLLAAHKERSPLLLVLQTPSNSFSTAHYQRWCDECCGKWKARHKFLCLHMEESCFFLYVNLNGLRANRYELMKMYLFVYKNLIGL